MGDAIQEAICESRRSGRGKPLPYGATQETCMLLSGVICFAASGRGHSSDMYVIVGAGLVPARDWMKN